MLTTLPQTELRTFVDWLIDHSKPWDLSWRSESGGLVFVRPSDDLFEGADDELFQAWEDLSWADQRFCIIGAAEQLAEIGQLQAGVVV
jgi:hypothetical protein